MTYSLSFKHYFCLNISKLFIYRFEIVRLFLIYVYSKHLSSFDTSAGVFQHVSLAGHPAGGVLRWARVLEPKLNQGGLGRNGNIKFFHIWVRVCFQINGHRSPWGHDSDPCFRSTGMLSLFSFFSVWVTQSTLRLLHLFECACELWHLPAFVSVMCVDVFSVLHDTQICLTFQFKIQIMYTREKSVAGIRRTGCFVKARAGMTNPFFFFFGRGSFFLSFPSVRVGQTPITCPIDLKQKRPHTAGRARGQADVKHFFTLVVFFVWAQSPVLSGDIKKALPSAGSSGIEPRQRREADYRWRLGPLMWDESF